LNLSELRTEFFARGFDYLSSGPQTGPNNYLNRAYHSICDAYEWPFLEADASGTAPLVVSDLRAVLGVVDTTTQVQLRFIDRRNLLRIDPMVNTAGSPALWYTENGTTIKVYPTNGTDQISVHYAKVPDDLSDSTDVPIIPSRFHMLIVDQAVVYAYEDSDNLEAASATQVVVDRRMEEMRQALTNPNLDTPDFILSTVDHQESV